MTRRLLLTLLACLGLTLPGYAEVRVLLFQTQTLHQIQVSSPGGLRVFDERTGSLLAQLPPGLTLRITQTSVLHLQAPHLDQSQPGPLRIEPGRIQARLWVATAKTPSRAYDGSLSLTAGGNGLQVCNQVSEQAYLTSVLAHEMPAQWPAEALKAQAILCRTYLAAHRHRHAEAGADVCDLTHCQVYGGHADDPRAANAVAATAGWMLTQGGTPVPALYHAACGGRTTSAAEVWAASAPASGTIPGGVSDAGPQGDYCRESPDYRWELALSPAALTEKLRAQFLRLPEPLQSIALDACDPSQRVQRLSLYFQQAPPITLSGDAFYRAWGHGGNWHQLKSTCFTLELRGGMFRFKGRGLGHGVGLCQWGARGRALAGWRYPAILRHYFPQAELTHTPEPRH